MEVDASVNFMGLTLRNPVVVAPASITGTAEKVARFWELGAGAAVMKTLFEVGHAPLPVAEVQNHPP